ncbi:MAG: metal ABC transporter permease, partial [Pseudomonadota bacterium]
MISLLMAFLITPISCLLLWNRMIVTVDAFIHACVLSSVLYIKFFIPLYLSMTITSFLFVLFFQYLKFYLERNEVLQIIAGVFMSITYLFIPAHMRGILFGDINSISLDMIYILCILTVILYVFIYFYYNRIVLMSLNSALDTNLNGNNNYIRFGLLFLVCLVLGSIIEYVGTVFIMPMVIIPGITARFFST